MTTYVAEGPIDITSLYPDLSTVHTQLFPEALPHRPSIEVYADHLAARGQLTPVLEEGVSKALAARESTECIAYIAGALTGVSEEMKERYGQISDMLASYPSHGTGDKQAFFGYVPHLHGTDPIKHPNVTPQEVRNIDFLWAVIAADVHVNLLSPMAHGNAIEEGWGESRLIPTYYLNPSDNKLSRLTLGMHNISTTISYDDFNPTEISEAEFVAGTTSGFRLADPRHRQPTALAKLRVGFDELHQWLDEFPERDPREHYYNGFYRLARAAARSYGAPIGAEGLDVGELTQIFAKDSLAAYIKNPGHVAYGKVGRIESANDFTGVEVTVDGNQTFCFNPLAVANTLSFWPLPPESRLKSKLQRLQRSPLPDPHE